MPAKSVDYVGLQVHYTLPRNRTLCKINVCNKIRKTSMVYLNYIVSVPNSKKNETFFLLLLDGVGPVDNRPTKD